MVKRKTARKGFRRALGAVKVWLRKNRHRPVKWQYEMLCNKLRGHYAYYGITGNFSALAAFKVLVVKMWRKWLNRRSWRKMPWDKFTRLLNRYPLPKPRVVHSIYH